jgi:putative aminopeptidase FrvX
MAHTDELGFRVRSINADGSLVLDNKGGGSPAFFWGHPALVHTSAGMLGAVVALPDGFDTAKFHFPADFRIAATLNVGVGSAAEAAALGIKVGDFVTIPKHMGTLANGRVTVRSLDDRVGCTAMVQAVWALGKDFHRDVTFVWSTREELGLLGAAAFAESAAKAGATPKTVFAIDTFVSSDTPLESHRFADGKLGEGFVVRAIDGSNIVPWADVQRVESIAKKHTIPVQYGVTGGGNDGATFVRYGATDVALSWPLRYAHSPGEVIDMRDVRALADIVAVLSREW